LQQTFHVTFGWDCLPLARKKSFITGVPSLERFYSGGTFIAR
jgi:hypothetical protein